MDMKKRIASALVMVLVLCAVCSAALADLPERIEVEQYKIRMPEIDIYFRPVDASGAFIKNFAPKEVKAVLGGKALSFSSIEHYNSGTTYYIMLDISGSMPSGTFSAVKNSIKDFISSMSAADAAVLITFGEKVTTVLNGSESKAEAIAAIDALKAKDKITRFFDAVTTVVNAANANASNLPSRRVALLITDGKDVSDAGSTTQAEMKESLIAAGLPLYALGIGSNKTHIDALGEFARSTGGYFASIDKKNCEETFSALKDRISSCYVMHLVADSNIIESPEQQLIIKLECDGKEVSISQNVKLNDWIPDNTAPYVAEISASNGNELVISFSEAVTGANDAANYSIKANINGKEVLLAPKSVYYDEATYIALLTFEDELYTGEYSVELANIADRSMEANAVSPASASASITGKTPVEPTIFNPLPEDEEATIPIWLISVLAAVVCIVIVIIVIAISKSKKNAAKSEDDSDEHIENGEHIKSTVIHIPVAGTRCQATVVDVTGMQRRVEFTVIGAYIVGRSHSDSNMSVDDKQLSRQHFQLTCENGCLYIEDLGSTNGTEVNGVPIMSKRPIGPNDIITAGNSKFNFTIL